MLNIPLIIIIVLMLSSLGQDLLEGDITLAKFFGMMIVLLLILAAVYWRW